MRLLIFSGIRFTSLNFVFLPIAGDRADNSWSLPVSFLRKIASKYLMKEKVGFKPMGVVNKRITPLKIRGNKLIIKGFI
jgi:hypothetical protein